MACRGRCGELERLLYGQQQDGKAKEPHAEDATQDRSAALASEIKVSILSCEPCRKHLQWN